MQGASRWTLNRNPFGGRGSLKDAGHAKDRASEELH
jgi:hypothetical protein